MTNSNYILHGYSAEIRRKKEAEEEQEEELQQSISR